MKRLIEFLSRLFPRRNPVTNLEDTEQPPKPCGGGSLAVAVVELEELLAQIDRSTESEEPPLQTRFLQNTAFSQAETLKSRIVREREIAGLQLRRWGDPARLEKVIPD